MKPVRWIILSPDARVIYKSYWRPPPDATFPRGSSILAPGLAAFVPLEGGTAHIRETEEVA